MLESQILQKKNDFKVLRKIKKRNKKLKAFNRFLKTKKVLINLTTLKKKLKTIPVKKKKNYRRKIKLGFRYKYKLRSMRNLYKLRDIEKPAIKAKIIYKKLNFSTLPLLWRLRAIPKIVVVTKKIVSETANNSRKIFVKTPNFKDISQKDIVVEKIYVSVLKNMLNNLKKKKCNTKKQN